MAVEDCNIYQQSQLGGYVPFRDPANPPEKYLRALDIETGKIAWEIPQVGPPESNYSGVLSTDGGLVFYGETGGGFAAVDAKTGKTLWHFETNEAVESFADDVYDERSSVRCDCIWRQHPGICDREVMTIGG